MFPPMREPGLDRSEWEAEWQGLEDVMADAPSEALSELDDLVARMLESRGFAPNDPIASEGDDPEVMAEFRAAREVRERVDAGQDVDPGDIASAINGYRALYEHIISERSAP
jgi:hypothetical protein